MKNRIREIRKGKGLSAEALAHQIGVTTNTMLNWEQGKTDFSSAKLVPLANALECKVTDILGVTER